MFSPTSKFLLSLHVSVKCDILGGCVTCKHCNNQLYRQHILRRRSHLTEKYEDNNNNLIVGKKY